MPRLMTKDDVLRTAADLGRADQVWSTFCDSSSCPPGMQLPDDGAYQLIFLRVPNSASQPSKKPRVKIGLMDGKWKLPTWEEDKAMDREIEADFEASLEDPL